MDESAPPQGSGLSVPVDPTDDDPPNGAELSAPSAKKARLVYQQPSSSGSSATGSLTVNEWLAGIDAEETQAAGFNLAAYMDSPAVVKAPLSSIFGSALLPLLDDDTVDTYYS